MPKIVHNLFYFLTESKGKYEPFFELPALSIREHLKRLFEKRKYEYCIRVVLIHSVEDKLNVYTPLAFGEKQITELEEEYDKENDVYYLYRRSTISQFDAAFFSMYAYNILTEGLLGFLFLLVISVYVQNAFSFKQERKLLQQQRDLLTFSKMDDAAALNKTTFALDDLLEDVFDEYVPRMEDKGIAYDIDAPKGVKVYADRARIRMAVSNYLSNAVKFTPEGGEIRLTLDRKRTQVSVYNSGPHIAKEDLERIWEFLYKADVDGAAEQGTGLGLPIVQRIVALHGGSCNAENTKDGVVFWFELPIGKEKKPRKRRKSRVQATGMQKTTIYEEGWVCRFVNTSGQELTIYADTGLKQKIGTLYRDSVCYCKEEEGGCVMVLYKVTSEGIFKVGFTDYVQGVQPKDSGTDFGG